MWPEFDATRCIQGLQKRQLRLLQSFSLRDLVMRKLCLLAASAVFAVQVMTAGGDNVQEVVPGIDTMPPVVTSQSLPCGVREFTATETRNIPDPPRQTPQERDQVETGLASVRLAFDPTPVNVRLEALTPATFTKDPKVTQATWRVVLIDPSKPGDCVVEVRDFKGNLTTRRVQISAATPTASATSINVGLVKVGDPAKGGQLTITNNTDGPMTLTNIALQTGTVFTITAGGTGNGPINLAVGASHNVAFAYNPVVRPAGDDTDVLTVTTACGNAVCNLSGTPGISRIQTTDSLTFDEVRADVEDCTPTNAPNVTITNTGNVDMQITGWNFSNPAFYPATGTPGAPIPVAAGASVNVNICFKSATLGAQNGTVTFNNDATDGADNVVNLSGNITTSVEDEMGKTARVWFDAANEQIVFTTVKAATPVTVHDINGRTLATATVAEDGNFRLSTASWMNGVVVITYTDANGQRTRTLSIVR